MKPSQTRRISRIAEIIRKEGTIDKINLCIKADITLATLYNYKPFIERLFEDITYDGGLFIHHKTEKIE